MVPPQSIRYIATGCVSMITSVFAVIPARRWNRSCLDCESWGQDSVPFGQAHSRLSRYTGQSGTWICCAINRKYSGPGSRDASTEVGGG